ncbi:MAG: 4-(cytidine 5'-diphospho)-2-C-methyl-D-erythritol kinase, partial [Planctomycetota bacterium]
MSSSSALELEAPAKLNLCLEVLGRRPDGYHEIDSVFAAIDLCDTVRLERSDAIRLTVHGEAAPEDDTNLAWRAAEALGVGASISLEKRIPAGAGLGGGSSDAAAVLLGLDRLYGLGTGRERLLEIALGLGADVPFFLTGGTARCRGVGERVEPLPPAPGRRYLLVIPALVTSTQDVYSGLEPGLTGHPEIATVFVRDYYRREGPG